MKNIVYMKIFLVILIIYFTSFSVIFAFNNLETKEVRVGKVIDNGTYDIDISWDNMKFIYNEEDSLVWNSEIKKYEIINKQGWTSLGNEIFIKNLSGKKISVNLNYIKNNSFSYINGIFDKNNLEIGNLKSENITLNLNGKMPKEVTEYEKIGEIEINIK